MAGKNRFGVSADLGKLRECILEKIRQVYHNPEIIGSRYGKESGVRWSESYQEHWLKARMQDAGAFPDPGCQSETSEVFSSCTLHLGFANIMETTEELARLKNDPDQLHKDSVARSKLAKNAIKYFVQPIDRVAYRVSNNR